MIALVTCLIAALCSATIQEEIELTEQLISLYQMKIDFLKHNST
jgi:hypothetical protein